MTVNQPLLLTNAMLTNKGIAVQANVNYLPSFCMSMGFVTKSPPLFQVVKKRAKEPHRKPQNAR